MATPRSQWIPRSPAWNWRRARPLNKIVRSQMKLAWMIGTAICAFGSSVHAAERDLVAVNPSDHDPLYVDKSSIQRNGVRVSFRYVIDVLAVAEARSTPKGWKSNEIEITIDCRARTYVVGRLTAYGGPRAIGAPVGGYVPEPPTRMTEKIVEKSTFEYLANYVCAKPEKSST